ncbi:MULTISPECIES: STAS domain-containing protein [unclassified Crossiella]|uniref:STAS domain-containing protein n=1 Tax=unclassified Crossiella TaxID=2620835 RepID=UPI001FFFF318|nr:MULTISPECIES: STAS domain-containing protein [unclassified Crossiella]MCK2245066.1 STAS domain-containing protein [Crossiella sp. S99.2]MCK2258647.1 STAS domain-containing protein [Crossiella sp. S99.1]
MIPATHEPGEPQHSQQMLELSTRSAGDALVLTAVGEIDLLTVDALRTALHDQLTAAPPLLVLDLGGVSFLASCGLAALVEFERAATEKSVKLRLVSTARSVTRPLEATGLLRTFELFDDVQSALP